MGTSPLAHVGRVALVARPDSSTMWAHIHKRITKTVERETLVMGPRRTSRATILQRGTGKEVSSPPHIQFHFCFIFFGPPNFFPVVGSFEKSVAGDVP